MEKTSHIRTVAFFVLFTVFLVILLAIFWPFYRPIAVSGMLAVLSLPLYKALKTKTGSKSLAAGICTLLIVFVIMVPLIYLTTQLFSEVNDAAITLSKIANQDTLDRSFGKIVQNPFIVKNFPHIEKQLEMFETDIFKSTYQLVENAARYMAANSIKVAKNIFWFILEIFIVVISVFFMLKESDGISNAIKDLSPFKSEETRKLLAKIKDTVRASVFGSISVYLIQGAMGALGFYMLGLPSPIMWGVIMAIIGIVPVVGPSLVWFPAAMILFLYGSTIKATALIIWGGLFMGSADNFLRPVFVGKSTQFHPLLIFFSIFGAIILMGPIGFFMGPLILSLTLTTADFLKDRYKD